MYLSSSVCNNSQQEQILQKYKIITLKLVFIIIFIDLPLLLVLMPYIYVTIKQKYAKL